MSDYDLSFVAITKIAQLERRGFEKVGLLLTDRRGEQVTVDRFGRVQWLAGASEEAKEETKGGAW